MKKLSDEADKQEKEIDDKIKENIEKEGFMSRLKPYNKPFVNVVLGTLVSII
jgi:hypothetical protein